MDGVRNHVMVEGKTVEDAELRATLADKLRYDRAGYGIVFNSLITAPWSGPMPPLLHEAARQEIAK